MISRDNFLKKMEAQELEWEAQLKHLQSRAKNFDADTRIKFEEQVDHLNQKLHEVAKRTDMFKKSSNEIWYDLGDNISRSWNEIAKSIDNTIAKLKK